MIRLILILAALSHGAERTRQDLINLVGRKGDETHLYDLYIRTGVASTDTTSGTIFAPTLSNIYGADPLRIQPHLRGRNAYASMLSIYSPILDSGASLWNGTLIDLFDCVDADTTCFAIRTRKGHVLIGDTLSAARLVQLGGGLQLHGSLVRTSRQIAPDTEEVLIGYPEGGHTMHDTLPLLSICLGCDYWVIQYQVAIDSPWVIIPHAGEKIEGFDSVGLRSNKGISYLHLFGQGDRWRVLAQHEEGVFLSSLGGISDLARDTGFYSVDNLLEVKVHVRRLLGTSNIGGATMSIFGLSRDFTDSLADTTLAATAPTVGRDSGITTPMTCLMFMNGTGIRCLKDNGANYAATLQKGTLYGMDFVGRLPRPARHR
jgi:hypothetical protein